jgi:hypothetical protein
MGTSGPGDYGYSFEEHLPGGWIEVWRPTDGDQWFVRWLPEMKRASDDTGHTYTPDEAGVANDPAELLAWAREKFGG